MSRRPRKATFVQGQPIYGIAIEGAKSMGVFRLDVKVRRPVTGVGWATLKQVIIDTGADDTWLPAKDLEGAGIEVAKRSMPYRTVDGRRIRRDVGYAVIQCQGFETVDEVVFAKSGDEPVLGANTIERFKALVDPNRKRLVPGPTPLAATRISQRRSLPR